MKQSNQREPLLLEGEFEVLSEKDTGTSHHRRNRVNSIPNTLAKVGIITICAAGALAMVMPALVGGAALSLIRGGSKRNDPNN